MVVTQVTKTGDGRLRVKLAITANPGTINELRSIRWLRLANATVTGLGDVQEGQTTPFAPGTNSATFFVNRPASEQATTVQVLVTDACGEWPTFFGGGPTAF